MITFTINYLFLLNFTVVELYENKSGNLRVNVSFVRNWESGFLWVCWEIESVISVIFCLKTLSREMRVRKFVNILNRNIKEISVFFKGNVFLRVAPYIFENSFISSEY